MDVAEKVAIFNTWAPIRPVNGFIAADFVWGCYQCSFCFNRDNFSLHVPDTMLDYEMDFESVAIAIRETPLFKAGTLVKFGHASDQSLQEKASTTFFDLLGDHALGAFYRRKPVRAPEKPFYVKHQNRLVLVMSLTPASTALNVDKREADRSLSSTIGMPAVQYALRPIARDSLEHAQVLLRFLPEASIVDICGLLENNGGESMKTDADRSASEPRLQELREIALERGLYINCSVNCMVRGRLGLGSFWADKYFSGITPATGQFCARCPSHIRCNEGIDPAFAQSQLVRAREVTGLSDLQIVDIAPRKLTLQTAQQVNRGDQTYLRNHFNCRVEFETPIIPVLDALTPEIYTRWQQSSFFPVDMMVEIGARMRDQVAETQVK